MATFMVGEGVDLALEVKRIRKAKKRGLPTFSELPRRVKKTVCQGEGCDEVVRSKVVLCPTCVATRMKPGTYKEFEAIYGLRAPAGPVEPIVTTIYFAGMVGDDHFVKIGRADNPDSRLRDLQIGNPFELRIIAAFDALESWEYELHRAFAAYRTRGEWFLMNDRLARLIECLKNDDQRGAIEAIYEEMPASA